MLACISSPKHALTLPLILAVALSAVGCAAGSGGDGASSASNDGSSQSGSGGGGTTNNGTSNNSGGNDQASSDSTIVVESSGPLAVDQLPINEWVQVKPGLVLAAGVPSDTEIVPHAVNYGNSTYRSATGEVVFYEGAQNSSLREDYYADAVASWDVGNNVVTINKLTNWGGSLYSGGWLLPDFQSDVTPAPRHVYDAFAYVSNRDELMLILGANSKLRTGTNVTSAAKTALDTDQHSTWIYQFGANSWERREDGNIRTFWPSIYTVSNYESHLKYWPEKDRMLFLDSNGTHAAEYDFKSKSWEQITLQSSPPDSLYGALSTWDSKRQRWVFRNGSTFFYYDPQTHTYGTLPSPTGLSGGSDVTYINDSDEYLAIGATAAETRIFNPNTGTWKSLNAGGATFSGVNNDQYIEYDSETGLVAMLTQGGDYYVLRYQP